MHVSNPHIFRFENAYRIPDIVLRIPHAYGLSSSLSQKLKRVHHVIPNYCEHISYKFSWDVFLRNGWQLLRNNFKIAQRKSKVVIKFDSRQLFWTTLADNQKIEIRKSNQPKNYQSIS